ncbi:NAD(P)H-dependent oxidoreductase [Pontibacter sp. BT731]|uniref:NADPH-dependent FMN reductase n=1 Tax=Pontibacter coccineus TaxID=3063328 RepID=UPI0026E46B5D|nr:NAD(P)H-dependent oxidoreductase [Pontibacter sp. BT731]MDO6388616.1 NAD(P)H-dependent oxidoreductase [Pontibacter sp. BT731]
MEEQQNSSREHTSFLVFSASLRSGSLNTKLAKLAVKVIEKHGGTVDFADMEVFECPTFNQDLEVDNYHPEGAEAFRKRILANDAMIISSPEYNGSMPGNFKNIIDWTSRFRPQPFHQFHALLMSASPSMAGGNRGLWALRVPFEHLGTRVYPDMFSLATAHEAFDEDGSLKDKTLAKRFEDNLVAFMNQVEASKHYPCIKKAWVEFLGEKTAKETERVE